MRPYNSATLFIISNWIQSYLMNIVRDLRIKSGTTQQELADMAGTSQSTIAAYENGSKSPTIRTLENLAHLFRPERHLLGHAVEVMGLIRELRDDLARAQARRFGSAIQGTGLIVQCFSRLAQVLACAFRRRFHVVDAAIDSGTNTYIYQSFSEPGHTFDQFDTLYRIQLGIRADF